MANGRVTYFTPKPAPESRPAQPNHGCVVISAGSPVRSVFFEAVNRPETMWPGVKPYASFPSNSAVAPVESLTANTEDDVRSFRTVLKSAVRYGRNDVPGPSPSSNNYFPTFRQQGGEI